jgi:predicted metal-dependent enzyme (double-stranded beta helix superfamily)
LTSARSPIHPALATLASAAKEMPFADCGEVLREALKAPAWLRPEHRVGDPKGYMRHLLYVDPEGDFVITAITWLPGQVSPVHGHQVWCAYGIAEGELTEDQYQEAYGKLTLLKTTAYRAGDVAERDLEAKTIHRVSNRSRGTIVSLHLYGVSADRLTTGINRIFAT